MAKPMPGRYRLTSNTGLIATFDVDETGMTSLLLGRFNWHEAEGVFRHPKLDIVIECHGDGTFSSIIRAGKPDEETHSGTCVRLAA